MIHHLARLECDEQHPSLMMVPQLKQISPTSNYTSRSTSKIIQVHLCHGPFLGNKRQKSHTNLLLAKLSEKLWFLILCDFFHSLPCASFLGLPSLLSPSTHFPTKNTHTHTHTTKQTLVTSPQASLCQPQTEDNGMTFGQTSSHGIQIHRHLTSLENLPRASRLRWGCSPWVQSDKDLDHPIQYFYVPNRFQRRPYKEER